MNNIIYAHTVEIVKRECKNKAEQADCDWWEEQGYCTDEKFKASMMDQCPCSCGQFYSPGVNYKTFWGFFCCATQVLHVVICI